MTLNTSVSDNEDVSSNPVVDEDVYRQLIKQFHESSIQRYGIDSEQTRIFHQHLTAHTAQD